MSHSRNPILGREFQEISLADADPAFVAGFNIGPVQWETSVSYSDTERAREALLVAQHIMDAVIDESSEYAGRVHSVAYDAPKVLGFLVMSQEYSPRQLSTLQKHLSGRVNDRLANIKAPFWLPWPREHTGI